MWPTSTVIVSKKASGSTVYPSFSRPLARMTVFWCTCWAIAFRPFGPWKDGIHRGHDSEQHLRGADVRRRLFAADMLFAGLQRQTIGAVAASIDGDADEAAGHGALDRILDRHIGRMRAAITHGHAEALGRADRDVCTHFTGRFEEQQCENVGGDGSQRSGLVQPGDQAGEIPHMAVRAGYWKIAPKHFGRVEIGEGVADGDRPAERFGAGLDDGDGLRVAVLVDEEAGRLGLGAALAERHGFGGSRCFIEERGIGHVETGEIRTMV